MKLEDLQTFVNEFVSGIPDKISDTLEDVEVMLVESPEDATAELLEEITVDEGGRARPITAEDQKLATVPADTKGLFIGDPMEREESEEDAEEETIIDPSGVIVLIANNLASKDEVVLVLMHEIGHALGLDEAEVKALGLAVSQQKGKPDATAPDPNG